MLLFGPSILGAGDSSFTVGVFAVLGIAITAAGGAWAVRRAKSGRIDTTEAADLWKEATGMRAELRSEVANLNAEIRTLKQENADLKAENAGYKRRLDALEEQLAGLRAANMAQAHRIDELESAHG